MLLVYPINLPFKKTSLLSPIISFLSPSSAKIPINLSRVILVLVDIIASSDRFFLKPISVPSGVSTGQNLP